MKAFIKVIFILLSFILLNVFSWLVFPNSFYKLFFADPNPGFGDTPYYVGIAKDGYTEESEWAYYPLYPLFIKLTNDFISHYICPISLERTSIILSIVLFTISIPLSFILFKKLLKNYYLFFVLYLFNPMIIFHLMGYTESLFSLFLVIFMLSFYAQNLKSMIFWIFISSLGIVLSRPVFLQFSLSVILAALIVFFTNKKDFRNHLILIYESILTSAVGFLIFLVFAEKETGDMLKTFHVQSLWGKKLGFYFNNLWANGTTWDLIALYLGIFVFVFIIFQLFKNLFSSDSNVLDKMPYLKIFMFWFSFFFFLSHVAIVFFTQDGDLRSLSRYVFSVPTTFITLGMIYDNYENKVIKVISYSFLVFSIVSLVYWWYMYSNTWWIG